MAFSKSGLVALLASAAAALVLAASACGGSPGGDAACVDEAAAKVEFHALVIPVLNGVPGGLPVGIGVAEGCLRPVHTHDASSMVHVASPEGDPYTLGDLFDVWGDDNPYRGIPVESLSVNGQRHEGDYRDLVLEADQRVVIAFREE